MTDYGTSGGIKLTDELINRLADEAEEGYDIEVMPGRLRGRPVTVGATKTAPVRLDPPLDEALSARAEADHASRSEVVRRALREYLKV